ncbi:MAG: DEAD/DEAH box helicase, partial [Candidatus Schekmanbacteria bacterium]|nr:DEAD/DEAH box helicase [Candidatus Schekmanbacteria bacterium]
MDVFYLREQVIADYASFVQSFYAMRDERIGTLVRQELNSGLLWPEPLVQLNPAFEPGDPLAQLVREDVLHAESLSIFRDKPDAHSDRGPLRLHRHQVESIRAARAGSNYVLTSGTGSGKSLAYIIPIVDHVLRNGSGKGIQAIIVYPMNALANSQLIELAKFLCHGYPAGGQPVTFERYTGQESNADRERILAAPPDILLTNYVMLELVLTRPRERKLVGAAQGLRFLVLDELHSYRGRQGADVAMLVRRVRDACAATSLIHVGTSATLAAGRSWPEQQEQIAGVASTIFGSPVQPEGVIGETLRRVTPDRSADPALLAEEIRRRLGSYAGPPATAAELVADPLASWVESTLGVRTDPATGRLARSQPLPIGTPAGAAAALAELSGVAHEQCAKAIRDTLLAANRLRDPHGRPVLAFRLHQWISKGEAVYASLEPEAARHITVQPQELVPGSAGKKILLPLAFCRECGQEYYVVRRNKTETGGVAYFGRELSDRLDNDDGEPGFLYVNTRAPWPASGAEMLERLPDSWLESVDGVVRVRDARRKLLPREIFASTDGAEGSGELRAHWLQAPFSFCLECGVAYSAHEQSDFGKLGTLGSEGRCSATTVLSLSTIRDLRRGDHEIPEKARKLLSFTDNRQDAALQAGHFNDFVEIGFLRAGLYRAAAAAGGAGIRHDELTATVFAALALPLELYAINPSVQYLQREETEKALRRVLGYYLYRDLRRGWRVTSPNLEQCGMLSIDYLALRDVAGDTRAWESAHPALSGATPAEREQVCRVMLDYMRRELAIRVNLLDPAYQETLLQLSSQYLIPPWALDEVETLERSRIVFPCSAGRHTKAPAHFAYLSPRGGFGQLLKARGTLASYGGALKLPDLERMLADLMAALAAPGILCRAEEVRSKNGGGVPGYQLNASALIWRAGPGERAPHDPVRVPNAPAGGLRTNPFFVDLYRSSTEHLERLAAREHTAQVTRENREDREDKFRSGRLPILYCSPTMELGVDISELNGVNMRNVPPTPANYAQRSG